jgi:alpha-beta hydrolase superfamily lysophospholipase
MPDLHVWHTASLSAEFTAADATPDSKLANYLAREEQLFGQLHEQVYAQVEATAENAYARYLSGGPQDPQDPLRAEPNWNRTFELTPENIKGGALLLHGLTDSPYSVRRIAEILHAEGFYVLGLRLPGHGTIPAALTEVHQEDWVAASRIAARHVATRVGPELPFVMGGYSNGGALTIRYSLDALSDPDLRVPDRAFLFSPEVGISAAALIANTHEVLSFLPYFAKFKWLSIEPEYDPYKYNSFPKNAAQQAHDLTETIRRRIEAVRSDGSFSDFPPVTTFLSWIDSTVETSATIADLYGKLENDTSELVIFDVNRSDRLAPLVGTASRAALHRLEVRSDLPYRMTVIANTASDSPTLAERSKPPRSEAFATRPLAYSWPAEVYSLAHVAIPFSPDDPVYGKAEIRGDAYDGLPLGALAPRGETGVLSAPVGQLMRLRHNPFFDYMERRIRREIDDLL